MDKYIHKIAGIYSNKSAAIKTRDLLIEQGFNLEQIDILLPSESYDDRKIEPEGNEVLREVVKDGAIGTLVGGGVGALGVAALAAANISLFLASPLLGPLTIIGWGASVGAIAGASVGAGIKEGRFADLVKGALNSGHTVLIVHATTETQTKIARDMIKNSVSDTDTSAIQSV